MKVEYLNPIIDATINVFKTMLQIEPVRGDISVEEGKISDKEVNVIIGLTGDLKGSIIYSFSGQMALEMVETMSGMEMDKLDKFVVSAIGEIANIISGKSAIGLSEKGFQCDIAPPQTVLGKELSIITDSDKVLIVSFFSKYGIFDIAFSLNN